MTLEETQSETSLWMKMEPTASQGLDLVLTDWNLDRIQFMHPSIGATVRPYPEQQPSRLLKVSN